MTVELPVLRWGTGARRAFLVHGLSSSAETWWRVASRLSRSGWSVVAPDLRGHGRAPVTETYRLPDMADDLVALGGGWDVVVGHSLGGALAVLAGASGGWAARLVLVDPALRVDGGDAAREAELAELEDGAVAALAAAHPDWHPEDVRLKARAVAATSPSVVAAIFDENRPWDLLGTLAALPVPVHVLGADPLAGGIFDPLVGIGLADRHPHVTYTLATGRGHSVHREDPGAVVAAVEEDAGGPVTGGSGGPVPS